jgi:hypothetical protein
MANLEINQAIDITHGSRLAAGDRPEDPDVGDAPPGGDTKDLVTMSPQQPQGWSLQLVQHLHSRSCLLPG